MIIISVKEGLEVLTKQMPLHFVTQNAKYNNSRRLILEPEIPFLNGVMNIHTEYKLSQMFSVGLIFYSIP